MKKITLMFFMLFVTLTSFAQLALESFEGSFPPTGWGIYDNGIGTNVSWAQSNATAAQPAHTGTYAAYLNRENVPTGMPEDWLVTPQFQVPVNAQVKFWSRLTQGGDQGTIYQLRVSTVPGAQGVLANYTVVKQWTENEINPTQLEYVPVSFNIPTAVAPVGSQIYVAFVMMGDQQDRWLIDDVQVISQCLDPTTLTATNITQTSASLSWANPSGATSWEIEVVPSTGAPTGTGFVYSSALPYVVSNLTPDTDYKYYVRAICSATNQSNWVGPYAFGTAAPGETCQAPKVIAGLPYSTTDNTSNYGDDFDGSPGATGCGTTSPYLNGDEVVYSYTATANGVISISMTNNGAFSGMFVYTSCANIGVSCAAGGTGNATTPVNIPSFSVTAGQTYYIVISTWATPQSTPYTLIIQQVNCAPPVGQPTTGIGQTSAQLSWTNPSGATSWQVAVQAPGSGIPQGAGVTATTNVNYLASGLTPATPYEYYVRADCGNGTFSAWAGPYLFNTTICEAANQCSYTFTLTDSFGDGWNGGSMTVSQNGITIATLGSTFTTGAGPVNVTVPMCDGLPFQLFWTAGGSFPGEMGVSIKNNFGQTIYTKAPGTGTAGTSLYTGTVNCSQPACLPPSGLTATNITTTTATLGWAGAASGSWEYYVVPTGSPAPTAATAGIATSTNPVNVTGLTAGTVYQFYVRIVCSGSNYSTWAGPFTFNTAVCEAANQCNYTFIMTDSFGDGWNGNTMSIRQNGATVATIGSTFTTGAGPISVTVPLCNGVPFELFWNSGGSFAGEVGISVQNNFAQTLYTKAPGTGSQNSLLYTGDVNCSQPACLPPSALTATNITTTTASLGWGGPATGTWEYIVLPAGSPAPTAATPGVATTTNPVTVSGLTAGTNYDFYVRVVCTATTSSAWAGPKSFHTQVCETANQCNYAFILTDSFGDGWNGNTMTISQNGVAVATIGSTFTTGTGPVTIQVPLCNNVPFTLFWNAGGSFATEVGISVMSPFAEEIYTKAPGTGAQNTLLYSGTASCTPPACPKPQNLSVSGITQTGANLNWSEMGSATNWEVAILPPGSPEPTTAGTPVTGPLPYNATGLTSGTTYIYYVRANCGAADGYSNWAGPFTFTTQIANDECAGAINVPVNPGIVCNDVVSGTVIGATASAQANGCGGTANDDVWFSFTATATTHAISLDNVSGSTTDLYHVLYSSASGCSGLTQLYCSDNNTSQATNLVVGQTYYIRVYTWTATPNQTSTFQVCVRTPPPPITVSTTQYTVPELITDVLIGSQCAIVTNITSSTGTNFGQSNGIGYFNQNGSNFGVSATMPQGYPEGIILATGNALTAPGPNGNVQSNTPGWPGDTDLEAIIPGYVTGDSNDATYIAFDFVPLIDQISFDFIFASEEYDGGSFECNYSDSFAFILTNVATGVSTNLAVLPNTTTPIQVTNIHPTNFSCPAINEEYFGGYSDTGFDPTNYNGFTKSLTAQAAVTAGSTYHIKLVIVNDRDNAYNSAVFLKAGSFNIGDIDLGGDLLVSQDNAVCNGGQVTLDSQLDPDDYDFVWSTPSGPIAGETGPALTVTTPGTYTLTASYENSTCSTTESVVVEFYPPVADITGTPQNLSFCDASGIGTFDLSDNTPVILGTLNPSQYEVTYYASAADAASGQNPLPLTYTNVTPFQETVYVRIRNTVSGCVGVKSFDLIVQDLTPQYTVPADFAICDGTSATIAVTPTNFDPASPNVSFTWSDGTNTLPDTTPSISVTQGGTYQVTVNNSGCSSVQTVTVALIPVPVADDPADVVSCDSYLLPALTNGNYYTAANGGGTMLNAGDVINSSQTVYVYSQSATTPNCTAENSFDITINVSPVVVNPGDQVSCNSYTLPSLTVGNYYTGIGGTGTMMNVGDVLTTSQTIYIYAQTGTTPNCTDEESFTVTVVPTPVPDDPADVTSCDSYVLPVLGVGNYYTGSNGTGTMLNAGDSVTASQTIYVYAASGTTPNCVLENAFDVTIIPSPVVTTPGDVTACNSYTLPSLTVGNYYTGMGGTGTMMNAGDVLTTSQTVYVYAQSGTTPNCTDEESFAVTIVPTPVPDDPADVTSCDSYVLPVLGVGNYYTGSNGTGTMLNAGDAVTSSQTIYVYAASGTTPNCVLENAFDVTIVPSPVVVNPGPIAACDSYTLPALTVGNYYTAANGAGTMLNAGTAITSSQNIYIYAQSGTTPNCTDEEMFTVTITTTPVVDNPADVTSCDSYVLPVLSSGNYFTGTGGTGTALFAGNAVNASQTVYVYASNGTCAAENSFVVTVVASPVVAEPVDVTECGSYTLPALTVGNYYTGPGGTGTMLAAGSAVTASQPVYIYAQSGTTPNCTDESVFNITINTLPLVDTPADVTACTSYTLPVLTNGAYYTGAGGTGTPRAAGDVINSNQTLYVYASNGLCTTEHSFDITIVPVPQVSVIDDCQGTQYVMVAQFNDNIYNEDNVDIEWRNSSNNVIGTGTSVVITNPGTYHLVVTPSGFATACPADVPVPVDSTSCLIQKGISPGGGDDKNNSFDLTGFGVNQISIFNRYGKEVFSMGRYTNEWHGQENNGNDLPTGTYFYSIARDNGENMTGWIYINRQQ